MKLTVKRDYWTFAELAERWGVDPSSHDLRRTVLSGLIRPALFVRGRFARVVITEGAAPSPVLSEVGSAVVDDVCGWVYLHDPAQVDAFEVTFHAISKDPTGDSGEMWELPAPRTLSELLADAVVMDSNMRDAEAVLGNVEDLSTKEKDSLLKLVAIMCADGYGWRNEPRSDVPTGIADAGKQLGISVSDGTVLKFLRMAWSSFPPDFAGYATDPNPIGLDQGRNGGAFEPMPVQLQQ